MKQAVNITISYHPTVIEKTSDASTQKSPFLAYAGMFSEEEGDAMLSVIQSSRHNKEMNVSL